MSRNANPGRIDSDAPGELLLKSSLIETNANNLMDELFAELEQSDLGILETRIVSAKTVLQSGHYSAAPWNSTQESSAFSYSQEDDKLDALAADLSASASWQTRPHLFPYRLNKDQLLLGVISVALVVPLLLWIGSQIRSRAATPIAATPEIASSSEVDAANAEFAAYVRRSLDSIDQKVDSVATQPVAVPTPNGSTPAASASLEVVKLPERIYVPVYQPPQIQVGPKAQLRQLSKPASKPKSIAKAATPLPAKTTIPTPAPVPAKSAPAQTLVGILELGDRSAALVGSNGVTRRVRVGEILAPGGWTLAQVSDQKAIIKRKGELRSIHVGQKF